MDARFQACSSRPTTAEPADGASETEVHDDRAFAAVLTANEKDVFALQITMNDAGRMDGREAFCDIPEHPSCLVRREPAASIETLRKRFTQKQRHRQKWDRLAWQVIASVDAELKNSANERMRNSPRYAHFGEQAFSRVGAVDRRDEQGLESNDFVQGVIEGLIDFAHPALRNKSPDFVPIGHSFTDRQRAERPLVRGLPVNDSTGCLRHHQAAGRTDIEMLADSLAIALGDLALEETDEATSR